MSEALLLEAAEPEDLPALVALERAAYSHPWSEASLREAVSNPRRFCALVLRSPGAWAAPDRGVRAYCIVQRVADELHIHNLAVAEALRRRGLARRLLLHVFGAAQQSGARLVLLEVREGNLAARALYESLGFEAVGHRRGYYTKPPEDAVLLRKALS